MSAWVGRSLVALGLVLFGAVVGAPWLYAEWALHADKVLVGPRPSGPAAGTWTDGYYLVEAIDPDTIAIGEPRYYQGNYSYLILGRTRAVLFDGGPAAHDIGPLVRRLTALPVTVVPSHLHYDHVGALGRLDRNALPDLPELRRRTRGGELRLERYEFLGFADGLATPRVRVDEWLRPGATVDLGGRLLEVAAVPGHTPTSIALYDRARRQLYAGDFIYPSTLYAFLPGSSRRAYLGSVRRLQALIDPSARIYTAHLGESAAVLRAPEVGVADLARLAATLEGIAAGTAKPTGFFPRIYPVHGEMALATGFAWNNR